MSDKYLICGHKKTTSVNSIKKALKMCSKFGDGSVIYERSYDGPEGDLFIIAENINGKIVTDIYEK